MNDATLLSTLRDAATASRSAVDEARRHGGARLTGLRDDQYVLDLVADTAAVDVLTRGGLGVMSEESGRHFPEREICVALDPLDGSTNCSRGIPWFGSSLCAVDSTGPRAAAVMDFSSGVTYEAARDAGAFRDGRRINVSGARSLGSSVVIATAPLPRAPVEPTIRVLGAASLELCLLAEGAIDGFLDSAEGSLATWDYLGASLIICEAGGHVAACDGRPIDDLSHPTKRTIVAASSHALLYQLMELCA
jgi:fructose-1,6-bisphosphatase/inositol monophosphatase family enzyme